MPSHSVRYAAARLAAVAMIGVLFSVLPLYLFTSFNPWVCLAVAVAFWGSAWYVAAIAYKGHVVYNDVADWQRDVMPDEGMCWIPDKHYRRLQYLLREAIDDDEEIRETQVFIVCRRHWMRLIELTALPVIGALACLVGALLLFIRGGNRSLEAVADTPVADTPPLLPPPTYTTRGPFILPPPGTYQEPQGWPYEIPLLPESDASEMPWFFSWWTLPLVLVTVAMMLFFLAWILSWRWTYSYLWVTNLHVAIIKAPPPILLAFMKRTNEVLQLQRVRRVVHSISGIGHLVDEGDVTLDTSLETDSNFMPLRHVPDPLRFEGIADAQRLLSQRKSTGG